MKKILIISTGGTFNKIYHPIHGTLEIDEDSQALKNIAEKWLCDFDIVNIIGKDSLEMTTQDRIELLSVIHQSEYRHILIVHGTDTIDITAEYLADAEMEKSIILTGAMVPYHIDPTEATANFAAAYGYLQALEKKGVFIVMNGAFGYYDRIEKNRTKGKFFLKS
ncbi:asparaginase [hydrothermal vent metagenome]|uniref:Asparaginase n=1 Tax=hydrothermal vent metagenome TaxID=652676 RepID=A0A1W1CRE5_9ZZZZ